MTVERVAAIVALLTPILVAAAAGIWKVLTYLLNRQDDTEPPIPQGQVIQPPAPDSWAARAAYDRALDLLDDERADHARTIDRHRACHALMREHGIPVPDDH